MHTNLGTNSQREIRILIVEDVVTNAELAERELRKANISFCSKRVDTKDAFLHELSDFAPDIILSDYSLPQFNGLEALRLLKQNKSDVPLILATGSLTEEVAVRCMKEGASDYILKTSLTRLPSAVLNVLEKVEAEKAKAVAVTSLRHSEQQYRLITENTRDLICVLDLKGNFVYVSPSVREGLGYEPEELIGRRSIALIHPDDSEIVKKSFVEGLSSKDSYAMELRYKHRSGEWRVFESIRNWVLDEKGNTQSAVVVSRDITERKQAEQQLKQSEEWLRAIFDASRDGILVEDNGCIVYVNNAYTQMLGYSAPEELVGTSMSAILSPDDGERMMKYGEARLRGETPPSVYEFNAKRKDGLLLRVEGAVSTSVIAGKTYITTAIRDITERKRIYEALGESEQRYRFLGEGIPHQVWTAQPDGNLDYVNERTLEYFGRTNEQMLGEGWQNVIHPDDLPICIERWMKSLQTGDPYEIEFRLKNADGTYLWHLGRATAGRGSDGKIIKWFGTNTDIDDKKRSEEALGVARAQLETTLEAGAIATWDYDVLNNRIVAGSNLAKLFSVTPEEEVGGALEYYTRAIHSGDLQRVEAGIVEASERGSKYEEEYRVVQPDGSARWVNARGQVERDAAGVAFRMSGVMIDITERKEAEQALIESEAQLRQSQKLEAVGQLAGGVAHDFNNLLTVITGYSDLILRRAEIDDPTRPKLEEIKKAAERAAALTRQLLAFSRKQVLQPKVIDLNSLVMDTGKMLHRLIGEDVDMTSALEPELGQIKADYGQVEQVLMNLVVNARDAMPQGGKLTIETGNVYLDGAYARQHIAVEPGNYVMLAVSDTGCGMDAATQAHIFEPFFTTKEVGKGTGLGLSTVFGIVKQSGGNIRVYSEPGRGTTFKIYLPRVDEAVESIDPCCETGETPQGSETILIVEDEAVVRELLKDLLEMDGYQVLVATDGGEALRICRENEDTIHLMITDVVMPQVSGREVARSAALIRPQMRVLFMSGYTDDAIGNHGVLDSDVAFMEKPFTPDTVACKVREVLDAFPTESESAASDAKSKKIEALGSLMKTAYEIILNDRQSPSFE